MRIISRHRDKETRKEQFETLVEVIELIRTKGDLEKFLLAFLTESEAAYLGQRLNIMRMLAKHFHYKDIKEKLGVPANTITRAQKSLDEAGDELKQIVLSYKYKPKKVKPEISLPDIKLPRYPGAIQL